MARLLRHRDSAQAIIPAPRGKQSEAEVLRWCREVVSRVNTLEPGMRALPDDALRALTSTFRGRLGNGEPVDLMLPEAFAAVREAAARTLGQRHFDVQIMGGAVLHLGKLAEMRTGEGKTLTATLPAYLQALSGAPVHVMTANDYLARRDAEWMGPVYGFLGMAVGLLRPNQKPDPFRGRAAGPAESQQKPDRFRALAAGLTKSLQKPDPFFGRAAGVPKPQGDLDAFLRRAAGLLKPRQELHPAALRNAYRADVTYGPWVEFGYDYLRDSLSWKRDEVVQRGQRFAIVDEADLILIDEMRAMLRVSGPVKLGETAEDGLTVRAETQTLAEVFLWDYLSQYECMAAMTGTAAEDADAYRQAYQLDVVTIPANKPVIRVDHRDVCYQTRQSKLAALAEETAVRHATGQPVLIGTTSVEQAEDVSGLLAERGIAHESLTALSHEQEARILAGAGAMGAVTVMAKMAGRGVGIVLGGADGAGRERVADLGGLCVLGAERSANRRLETNLRGRAGRQGDPGEAKFFVSFEDDLLTAAAGAKQTPFLSQRSRDGQANDRVSGRLTNAQAKAAAYEAWRLARAREFDRVLTEQRRLIYAARAPALDGKNLRAEVLTLIDQVAIADVATKDVPRPERLRLAEEAASDARRRYQLREAYVGPEAARELERNVILAVLDHAWREHLQAMPELVNTIIARTKGDAAVAEYRREATLAFNRMRESADAAIVRNLLTLKLVKHGRSGDAAH
jgi:preprotein translocase subunit SecA